MNLNQSNLHQHEASRAPTIGRNRSLDGMRGIAVILTFLVHYCGTYMATFRGGNPNVIPLAQWHTPFDKVMYWLFHSHHGVFLFFLLSGYLIAKIVLAKDFSYGPFVRNRILRIYPAFLFALVICIAARLAVKQPLPTWPDIGANLLFLNGIPSLGVSGIAFNNVTWSLFYEMVFYLSFPVMLLAAHACRIQTTAATILAGVIFAYVPSVVGFYAEFFVFLFAVALAGTLSQPVMNAIARNFPDILVVLLYLLITGLLTAGCITMSQFVWLFSGTGFVLLCKATAGEGILVRLLSWTPLVKIGRISYSVYLLHSVALAALFAFWWRLSIPAFGTIGNAAYLGALASAASIGLGWVSFIVAERWYFKNRKPLPINPTKIVSP